MADDDKPPTAPPSGEPAAGTEPGGDGESTDTDTDSVLRDPGTAGDSPDPDVAPPSAVISAEGG